MIIVSNNLLSVLLMASTATKANFDPFIVASGLGAIAYAGICLALYQYQSKLIFRPLPTFIGTPADVGIPYEDVWIPLSPVGSRQSNEKLHGWWLPNPRSDRTLLMCHGNYGNISYNLERIRFHYSLGFSVFAFDYRGYGQSSGPEPTELNTYADAEAAWQYLITQRQSKPSEITVMGHSMGGAIAIHLAAQHPDMAHLIVKSSFTSMQAAVEARSLYRLFPIKQLLAHPFDSLSKVSSLKVPVLYVHGDQDPDLPPEMSQQLYEASPEPKQLWYAAGAHHNNIHSAAGNGYARVVQAFCTPRQLQSA
ncbi:MAG: alpha/beta fold hydrolase [Phormidesmis sp.]